MDGAAGSVFKSSLNPVQITKRAEKAMYREKLVNAGVQYAPTLYSVILSADDDHKLAGFYPTLAGEMETYLRSKAEQDGMVMDGEPLVRFIADQSLRRGKFDVIAENVSAPIVEQLRSEEMQRYGLASSPASYAHRGADVVHDVRNVAREGSRRQYRDRYDERPQYKSEQDPYADAPHQESVADFNIPTIEPAPANPYPMDQPAGGDAYYEGAPSDSMDFGQSPAGYAPQGQPVLINVRTGETYPLSGFRVSVGRERGNNICIRDANISRSHAEIINDNGTWFIRDLGSTNGTQVNGQDVMESDLYDGDNVTLGMTTLEFRIG